MIIHRCFCLCCSKQQHSSSSSDCLFTRFSQAPAASGAITMPPGSWTWMSGTWMSEPPCIVRNMDVFEYASREPATQSQQWVQWMEDYAASGAIQWRDHSTKLDVTKLTGKVKLGPVVRKCRFGGSTSGLVDQHPGFGGAATEMPMGSLRRHRDARWAARGARMGAASSAAGCSKATRAACDHEGQAQECRTCLFVIPVVYRFASKKVLTSQVVFDNVDCCWYYIKFVRIRIVLRIVIQQLIRLFMFILS